MKKLLFLATALAALTVSASAQYVTKSAGGNASSGAAVNFISNPSSQINLVNLLYQSDTNNGALQFSTGVNVYNVAVTNAATTSVTNQLTSTNGLLASAVVLLEHLGAVYPATISSYGSNSSQGAFIVLGSGGFGVFSSVNDKVHQMGTATSFTVGAATNTLAGVAVFSGNQGRPVRVVLTPANVTNRLINVTANYQ